MTDRDAPIRRYADLFRKPEPSLTLEMVEKAVAEAREVLDDEGNCWTPRRREGGKDALYLFMRCLRQQMGGGQG